MDVEFILQDSYALTRPQWKLATDLSEAARLFGDAVAQNYKVQETDKAPEPDDEVESSPSDDGLEDDAVPDADEERSSSEEVEVYFLNSRLKSHDADSSNPNPRRLYTMPTKISTLTPKKSKSLSLARKKSATLRLKQSLIAHSRKWWLRVWIPANSSVRRCLMFLYP